MENKNTIFVEGLVKDPQLYRKYYKSLKPSFFDDPEHAVIVTVIDDYFSKYNIIPDDSVISAEILASELAQQYNTSNEKCVSALREALDNGFDFVRNKDWYCDNIQTFIQQRGLAEAMVESYDLVKDGRVGEVYGKFEEIFSTSFDDNLGVDYFDSFEERYERMNTQEDTITTGIEILNKRLGGGWRNKSLNMVTAPANAGKTVWLLNFAKFAALAGKNVAYFTFEISEDEVAKRIDASMFDNHIGTLQKNQKSIFNKMEAMKEKCGRIIVKEYAPDCMSTNDLVAYLKDVEVQKKFRPDIIIVDYLGLMIPNTRGKNDGMYESGKKVAVELRKMAFEYDCPVLAAAQVNRDGYNNSAPGMESISESIGVPQTADTMIIINRTEEYDTLNQVQARIVKSRFSVNGTSCMIGAKYENMSLYDLDGDANDFSKDVETIKKNNRTANILSTNAKNTSGSVRGRNTSGIK